MRDKNFCYSWDDECYRGGFATEEEAIKEAKKDKSEATEVYIGTETDIETCWTTNIEICRTTNEEEIIDSIIQILEEEGEKDGINRISRRNKKILKESSMKKVIKLGDRVCCTESGVSGVVIKQYVPTTCEQYTMIQCDDGRQYYAPTRFFVKIR